MTDINKPVPEGPGFLKTLSTVLLASGMFVTGGMLAGKRAALGQLTPSDWVTVSQMIVTIGSSAVIAAAALRK